MVIYNFIINQPNGQVNNKGVKVNEFKLWWLPNKDLMFYELSWQQNVVGLDNCLVKIVEVHGIAEIKKKKIVIINL